MTEEEDQATELRRSPSKGGLDTHRLPGQGPRLAHTCLRAGPVRGFAQDAYV
jgi:hypothetical protein